MARKLEDNPLYDKLDTDAVEETMSDASAILRATGGYDDQAFKIALIGLLSDISEHLSFIANNSRK